MELHNFEEADFTKFIVAHIQTVEELKAVTFTNPASNATFPVCVIQAPLQRPRYGDARIDFSITVEVWADAPYEALEVFGKVKQVLKSINLMMNNTTPQITTATKWRYGGYFEARYNAITNGFERNR